MTKEEFYSNPLTIEQLKKSWRMYANDVVRFRSHVKTLKCGRCGKALTENEYVYYNGYCDDCLYEVNANRHIKSMPQDEVNLLLAHVLEFSNELTQ